MKAVVQIIREKFLKNAQKAESENNYLTEIKLKENLEIIESFSLPPIRRTTRRIR